MTEAEFIVAMANVSRLWPHFKPVEGTYDAGYRLMGHLSPEAVVAAIDSLALEGRDYAPMAGQIAKRAVELQAAASGDGPPGVDEAWSEVQSEIARVGWTGALDPSRKPMFSHSAISAAVEAMGWQTLCESDTAMADRAHFLKLYGSVIERANRDALTPASVRALGERLGPAQLEPAP